jgi:hypothetical protein
VSDPEGSEACSSVARRPWDERAGGLNRVPDLNVDMKSGKLVVKTREFGTVYLVEEDQRLEMTESQIRKLKTSLGF